MDHASKVEHIAAQLRQRTGSSPVSLRKKAVAHQVPKAGDLRRLDDKIDVSALDAILRIDVDNRLCVAEPGVTFVDLVAATLPLGLVPIVVPELKTITIGGAVSGCSIESTSFMYGGFHDNCIEYEVITASGEVLVCRADNEHAMVFQMMHGSFGTLGILSQLTFRLMPAKPFVKIVYEKHGSVSDYLAAIDRHYQARDVVFMDGIIHSTQELVLSLGHFVDEAPYTSNYDWMKIYYQSTKTRSEDYLPTSDYFFRYDRGVTNVRPSSWIGRLLVGWFLNSTQILRIAERWHWLLLQKENPTITLDVFIPFSKIPEFFEWYEREFQFFPLWCVPYHARAYEWMGAEIVAKMKDELFVDLAIYGMKQSAGKNHHRLMEEKLRELGGVKTLIAHNYYGEEEFWQLWHKPNYDAAKAVTDPKNIFRDLYTKTCKAAMGVR